MNFALLNRRNHSFLVLILVIFYTVGTIGLLTDSLRPLFLPLSFFNLLLSFAVMCLSLEKIDLKLLSFLVLFFLVGLCVEWVGVHTGWLFGDYFYGINLGPKLFSVPLVIGLNWAMLVLCSASVVHHLQVIPVVKAILGASLMTFLDFLMEPVAIKSGFWLWNTPEIPLYNYICWFIIAFLLHWAYCSFVEVPSNKVMNRLFVILVLFFSILNFV
jgi:putative membrane protein